MGPCADQPGVKLMRILHGLVIVCAMLLKLGGSQEIKDGLKPAPSPTESGIYVENFGKWQLVPASYPAKVIQGHMQTMGKSGLIAVFADGESVIRANAERPRFCAVGMKDIHLLVLQMRGKERRVIVGKISGLKGAYGVHPQSFAPDTVIPILRTESFEGGFMFQPELPLPNGEYAIFADLPSEFPRGSKVDPHLVKGYGFGRFSN